MSSPSPISPPTSTWYSAAKRNSGRGFALAGMSAVASSMAVAWVRYRAQQADRKLPTEFVLEVDLERLKVTQQVNRQQRLTVIR